MSNKIGIVGLGLMGQNLALNMERNGFPAENMLALFSVLKNS